MKRRRTCGKQAGETLVGLLVGLALGLGVLAMGAQMLARLLSEQHRLGAQSRRQQDLHFVLERIANEVQDAQYSAHAWRSRDARACNDAFCDGPEDFSIGASHILWSFDRNHDGVQDNNECTGYRLRAGSLQQRSACQPETWVALSDPASLSLSGLSATLHCQVLAGWVQRQVQLTVQAKDPAHPSGAPWVVEQRVLLRNNLPASAAAGVCP